MAVQTVGTISRNGYVHERALLPVKPLVLLSKCLKNNVVTRKYEPGASNSVKMSVADEIATFHCGEVTIFTRLIEGRFPSWRTIVPTAEHMHKAVVHGWDFHEALKVFKTRSDGVKFSIADGTLTLSSKTTKQTLAVDCDVDGAIGFDPKFWIDIAKVLGGSNRALSKDMRLFFPGGVSDPAMLTTDDGYCYVVMPLSDVGNGFPVIPAAEAEAERKHAEIMAKVDAEVEAKMQAAMQDEDDEVRTDCEFDDVVYHDVDDAPMDAVSIYHEACADEECPQWKRDYYKANAKAQAQASQKEFAMDDDEESAEMDTVTVYRPYFCHEEGVYLAMGERVEESYIVEWSGAADYCDWNNPSRIVTLDEYNVENAGNAHLHVPAQVLDGYEQEADVMPDEWVEEMFPGAECHVKAEPVEKPTAYVPSIEDALAEMIENSAYPDILDGSTLATVQREDGRAKSGALLKTKGRGRGHVFMEWETGFVYRTPAKDCKQSKSQGFTVLTLSYTTLRKERNLQNIFTARSLF